MPPVSSWGKKLRGLFLLEAEVHSPAMGSNTATSKPDRIVVFGPPQAGKTSIIYRLKLGEEVVTSPTVGALSLINLALKRNNRVLSICDTGCESQVHIR